MGSIPSLRMGFIFRRQTNLQGFLSPLFFIRSGSCYLPPLLVLFPSFLLAVSHFFFPTLNKQPGKLRNYKTFIYLPFMPRRLAPSPSLSLASVASKVAGPQHWLTIPWIVKWLSKWINKWMNKWMTLCPVEQIFTWFPSSHLKTFSSLMGS